MKMIHPCHDVTTLNTYLDVILLTCVCHNALLFNQLTMEGTSKDDKIILLIHKIT